MRGEGAGTALSSITRAALDGGLVTISVQGDLDRPWGTYVEYSLGGSIQQFGAGGIDFAATIARELSISLDEQYSFQGGRLRIGSKSEYNPVTRQRELTRIGVWEGWGFSLKAVLYNRSSKDMIGLLERFTVTETPNGLVIDPVRPALAELQRGQWAPRVAQNVPDLGLISIRERTPEREKRLPKWKGMTVSGGELFVDRRGTAQMTFALAGETAVTRLYPNSWEADVTDILDRFSEAKIDWLRGGVRA
jgi:hypothetical protein